MGKRILVHPNFVNSDYKLNSRTFYIFIPNKSFGQLLEIYYRNFFTVTYKRKNKRNFSYHLIVNIWKRDIGLNLQNGDMSKFMGFYLLLNIMAKKFLKLLVANVVKNIFITLKNWQRMLLRLLQKEQFKR